MADDPLKTLANPTNQAILTLLLVEPTYPRKIGDLLSLPETEVARRLRAMEKQGIVQSGWQYIGKNVKLYELRQRNFRIELTPEGLRVQAEAAEGGPSEGLVLNPFPMHIPDPDAPVGREAESAILAASTGTVLLTGIPGIGKTSLAAHQARAVLEERGPGSVFWHSFRGVESLNWLANRLGVFLAQHGRHDLLDAVQADADLTDKRQGILDGLRDTDAWFIFEDVHRIQEPALQELLTDAANHDRKGTLVLTGRKQIPHNPSLSHIHLIELGGIDDEHVQRLCAQQGHELDAALVHKVREEVGGHPLALILFLRTVEKLGVEPQELLDRVPERDLEDYLLQEIHGALGEDEQRVLGHASLFRTTFDDESLSVLSKKSPQGALLRLRKASLVGTDDDGYMVHEVIRNFFYNLLQDRERLHEKVALHYSQQGTLEGRLEAMHHYLQADRRDKVLSMIEEDLDLRDYDAIDAGYQGLYLEILELFAKGDVRRQRQWALIQDEKGDIWYHRGDHAKACAYYDEAVTIFAALKDDARLADLAWKRALCKRALGDDAAARSLLEDGLGLAEEASPERERIDAELARLT